MSTPAWDAPVLHVDVDERDDATVLVVHGEVDVYTASRLRDPLNAALDAGARMLILDLAGLAFMDSTGLGILVGAWKRATAAGGGLALAFCPEHTLKVLRVTGLDKQIPAAGLSGEALTREDALERLRGRVTALEGAA